ncbi:hypothetical protein NBRC10512_003002 [Rhodotorula toruloides]|uniref:RHTO0S14e03070g1_1 n=2 Tax=Rhodotorula toruloides TaxID=5286 RepID=A0A061BDF3_RHOTO|nr:uncharacterized protein RHTO_05020 [Rhodotorula toruloides NP11]EMS24840.1 hypothetical protein RHTO_05020 [Rhodotorula toruloides NP11]KAJ8297290.1 hypothetical protein OF846_000513 [Rhodotorula toruloides]CDR47397.1 RHTO0S14e03070g1_1 [Rhodotorula toruloides]
MSAPSPSAPGYLWVLSDPGEQATLEEFQDWYDNEHVPLRMEHIPEFETGARYEAADGQTPGWSAAYDIRSVALFSDNKYTRLRANRSPREGALVARLGVLDRRTAEKLGETSPPPAASEAPKFVLTAASEERPDESELRLFEGQEGWRRSHYHRVYDSLIIGYGKEAKSNVAPKFVVIHEFDTEAYTSSPAYAKATEGKTEVRRWKLYKATPNTAPKDA